ncbi:MAG: hypothetical protein R2745_23350 [Vicinamibacterales bacterium]
MIGAPPRLDAERTCQDAVVARPRVGLTTDERGEMLGLLHQHFDGVDPGQFARDLDEKDWVLQVRRDGALVGFSTLLVFDAVHDGRPIHAIYSGDTIVAPAAWGTPALARGWIALVRGLQARRPPAPWYWLLLSSGFRTYRFLPVFWRAFWPRHDAPTPAEAQTLLDALARARCGDAFDAAAGVVRFRHPHRLRGGLVEVPEGRTADPHVQFFLARNPGHADGDELVCLTDLGEANLTAAGRRMVRGSDRPLFVEAP